MGDGTLIALWTAVFANKSETNKMWEFCADHIRIAGYPYAYYACIKYSPMLNMATFNTCIFV
jgi:hypothetical protein